MSDFYVFSCGLRIRRADTSIIFYLAESDRVTIKWIDHRVVDENGRSPVWIHEAGGSSLASFDRVLLEEQTK